MKSILLKSFAVTVAVFLLMGSRAVFAEDVPDCMKDVKAGEWANYKMQGGMEMKQTITKVTDEEATMKTEMFMNGEPLGPAQESKIPRKAKGEAKDAGAKPKVSSATVKVKGKEIKCVVVEGNGAKNYMSNDVPVTGLVKTEMGGNVTMELVDCGTK